MNKWFIFFLVAVGVFMSTLDGSIVNIAIPTIMKDLNSSISVIEWVVSVYLLTVSSLLLSFGRISDIKGRRIVYSLGLSIFAVGSLFCALSDTAHFLIISRSVQGFGASMIMACTPALVVDTFPPEERGKALGMIGTTVAAGLTAGPALGGLILHFFSWRVIFYINVPIGIFAALTVFFKLKGSSADKRLDEDFDFPGLFLIAATLILFILIVNSIGSLFKGISGKDIALLAFFAVSLYTLIKFEKRVVHPMLNISLFKKRVFTMPVVSAVIMFASLFINIFLMPFYLMYPRGFTPGKAGIFMVIPFFFMFVISPFSGSIAGKKGSRVLCTIGMCIITTALVILSGLNNDSGYLQIITGMSLLGIGISLFSSPNTVSVMNSVSPKERGVAGGIVATARNLGMVIGVTTAGTVFNHIFTVQSAGKVFENYYPQIENAFFTAFRFSLLTGALIAFIGIIISWSRGKI